MSLTEKEVRTKLMAAVGKEVAFSYPGKHKKRGILKGRVVFLSGLSPFGGVYWDVVDRIEFPDDKHRYWVRIGYFRQIGNALRFASQTTITEPAHKMKRLLAQAAKEEKWFRKVLAPAARHAFRNRHR